MNVIVPEGGASYRLITRRWWWRGFSLGMFMGVFVGAVTNLILLWLTGSLA